MKEKAYIFVLGGTSTIALSIFLFILTPRIQVQYINEDSLSAQSPYTANELAGRRSYINNGCIYCHSQQVRDPSAGADHSFGWGRPSIASDYIYDSPHLLGTMRTGPDLSNIGQRQPSKQWLHLHFYNPRLLVKWSIMPGYPFLYKKINSSSSPDANAIRLSGSENEWIVPTQEAQDLVAYLLSLKRNRDPIKASEVEK